METILETKNPNIQESDENMNGCQIYFLALSELEIAMFSDTEDVPPFIIESKEEIFKKIHYILSNKGNSGSLIATNSGINAEVLFYISIKDKIPIRLSTLKEDYFEFFDFTLFDKELDVTSSMSNRTFIDKFNEGHPPCLLIPKFSIYNNLHLPIFDPPFNERYAYKLIYENKFDKKDFLKSTLEINYKILDVLKDCYKRGDNNSFGLKRAQYGRITKGVINRQKGLLKRLSKELNIPIDKTWYPR